MPREIFGTTCSLGRLSSDLHLDEEIGGTEENGGCMGRRRRIGGGKRMGIEMMMDVFVWLMKKLMMI